MNLFTKQEIANILSCNQDDFSIIEQYENTKRQKIVLKIELNLRLGKDLTYSYINTPKDRNWKLLGIEVDCSEVKIDFEIK